MKILAIGAHPDDIEIGCGGTLAKCAQEGAEIEFVIATRGEAGSQKLPKAELANLRTDEAHKGAEIIGAKKVHFLDMIDGLTQFEPEHKIALINIIRSCKPDTVYIHSQYDHSLDHEIIHRLSLEAIRGASGPWFQECKNSPHEVTNIFGYEVWNPLNVWQKVVDITDTIDTKVKALNEHQTQIKAVDYVSAVKGLASYRGALSFQGAYAEVFDVYKI